MKVYFPRNRSDVFGIRIGPRFYFDVFVNWAHRPVIFYNAFGKVGYIGK
jgi:hypothetical protein